jgi:precorrin-6A synthase
VRHARLIGIGPGGADQLTVEAVQALRSCDAFLVADKGADTSDLLDLRTEILTRHVPGPHRVLAVADPPRDRSPHTADAYERAVDDWHDARATAFADAIVSAVPEGGSVGFLVWGDPALYDSTIRVLDRIVASGPEIDYDVVPGVSAVSLLAARHRLVLNTVGSPVTITTGRRLLDSAAEGADNLVVMLDGSLACGRLDPEGWDIWWGANMGTCDEALVSGPLADVLPEIREARAKARAARGWVMDTYLLRRRRRC